ncbi:NADP-dependent oxidoreductase [Dactylosporangium sp. NPDC000244]|uniref:NADP-dependent oxidoreductase n=1 Tax=Dactylosporangium sp. NPDC000244 TaxID=3154365 RepID=UPI00331C386C
MLAVQFAQFGPPEVLQLAEAPDPHPGPGEVRIRVRAAGVSPVDVALRAGTSPSAARLPRPHIPGVDAAGVIDELGPGVTGWAPGDEVFGIVPLATLGGATAQLAVLRHWARRPPHLPWAEAGAAATSLETATRALDRLALEPGMRLLVTGAAGGVGSIAVQLAVLRGVRVYGTGSSDAADFVAALGAEPLGREIAGRFDRALDTAGGGLLPALIEATGDAARVLSIADFTAPGLGAALSMGEPAGEPGGHHGLAEAARIRVPLQATYPMSDAPAAHRAFETTSRRGKLAYEIGT